MSQKWATYRDTVYLKIDWVMAVYGSVNDLITLFLLDFEGKAAIASGMASSYPFNMFSLSLIK